MDPGLGREAPQPGSSSSSSIAHPARRPPRPCDACRKRKSRCEIQEGETACVLCKFHHQACLFNENPAPRKRRRVAEGGVLAHASGGAGSSGGVGGAGGGGTGAGVGAGGVAGAPRPPPSEAGLASVSSRENVAGMTAQSPSKSSEAEQQQRINPAVRLDPRIDDYANLKGPSLLKSTLGLQNHQHSKILGLTSVFEQRLLTFQEPGPKGDVPLGQLTLRKVTPTEGFILVPDASTKHHAQEIRDLDDIESVVAPHGQELINLYFRIVHPTFPILHKKVFLEKYQRTHREFSPPLLAAVYLLAIDWWSYSMDLSTLPKPDVDKLEVIAQRTMSYIIARPKLSTIQAGLLLLQRPEGQSWALTGKLVALGQDIGLHYDCTRWKIPGWERGLRKRLAWALWMQDKWGSLMHGRPSHISSDDWMVKPVSEQDFPERSQDEDDKEGSTEVENGRILFCEMIKLTEILAIIISEFYTLRAEAEFQSKQSEGGRWVLERAKPIQLALKEWFTQLPDCLKMEHVKMRKLSSTGYLHLAYYATEITLHRRILTSLTSVSTPSLAPANLVNICRTAAHTRLTAALEFVKSLRAEHLQSFWYSASKYNFVLLGTFIGLLWTTAGSAEEMRAYRERFDAYRWTLRLAGKSSEILDQAANELSAGVGTLVRGIPEYGQGPPAMRHQHQHQQTQQQHQQLQQQQYQHQHQHPQHHHQHHQVHHHQHLTQQGHVADGDEDEDEEDGPYDGGEGEEEDSPSNTWSIEQPMGSYHQHPSPTAFSDGSVEMFWQGLHISPSYDMSAADQFMSGQDAPDLTGY